MIKAPFNFVPLPDIIVFPEWGKQVSQDIPFEDGVSGSIDLQIEAKTDIFVRNGNNLRNVENKFSHIGQSYFIPGSTLKGCFRTVLEIFSFGKIKQFNQHSFALRDLRNDTYKRLIQRNITHGGWLYLHDDTYYIYDCGVIKRENRITAYEIDEAINSSVFNPFITQKIQSKDKNAATKYKMLANALSGHCTGEEQKEYKNGERFFGIDGKYLVFTGQPGNRQQKWNEKGEEYWVGKGKEFLFNKPPQQFKPEGECIIPISPDDMKAFQSIHNSSTDYTEFWKSKLAEGKPIPVFFQEVEDSGHCKHHYIGLSYMFKYPVKDNVESAMKNYYDRVLKEEQMKGLDMADLIFGYQSEGKSLRGRVMIGHAFAEGNPTIVTEKITTMSSPRPSYYPLYLKRDESPVTWNDSYGKKIEIAGYKRYPVRGEASGFKDRKGCPLGKMDSAMIPLKQGTKFKSRIVFHNLRPVELGALLYAITLCNLKEKSNVSLYHNIGACKSYGYGKVSITPILNITDGKGMDFYYQSFIDYMQEMYENEWIDSPTIREIQAMAAGIPDNKKEMFTYMELSKKVDGRNINEFVKGKESYNEGERLRPFTEIIEGQMSVYKQIPASDRSNQQKNKNDIPNRTRSPYNRQGNDYSIKEQEQTKGWRLKEGGTYKGMITNKGILLIYCPDVRDPAKTIKCKFSVDKPAQHPGVNCNVNSFRIVEISNDTSIVIHINKYTKRQ